MSGDENVFIDKERWHALITYIYTYSTKYKRRTYAGGLALVTTRESLLFASLFVGSPDTVHPLKKATKSIAFKLYVDTITVSTSFRDSTEGDKRTGRCWGLGGGQKEAWRPPMRESLLLRYFRGGSFEVALKSKKKGSTLDCVAITRV